MIYGDNPQRINERQDVLGLRTYSYAPEITAIMQAGNLYVYGINNPVAYRDRDGKIAWLVIGAVVGAVISAGMDLAAQIADGTDLEDIDWTSVVISSASGAISGALGVTGIGVWGQVLGNAALSGTETIVRNVVSGEEIDWNAVIKNTAVGAFAGMVGGAGLKNVSTATYTRLVSGGGQFGLYTFSYTSSRLAERMAKEFAKNALKTFGYNILVEVIDNKVYAFVEE